MTLFNPHLKRQQNFFSFSDLPILISHLIDGQVFKYSPLTLISFCLMIVYLLIQPKQHVNNMKIFIVVLVALVLILPSDAAITHLSEKNFYEKINSSPFTFVYFYSSSCQFCKQFTPKFQKLSKSKDLEKLGVQFGKMDAPMYKNFSQNFQVYSYPTLAVFFKDVTIPIIYRKQRQQNAIFNFILKVIQPSNVSKVLEHYANLTPDQMYFNKLAIFNGKYNSQQFLTWDILTKRDGYIEWSFNESDTTSLVIGQHTITDFSNPLETELAVERYYAKLHDVTEESWTKMAEKKKFTIVYMNKHENKKTVLLLAKLSRELGNVHFIIIGGEDENWGSALRYLGINDEQNIIAVDKLYDVLYIAPVPYSQNSLKEFIQKAQKHQLQIYRKSQKTDKVNKLTRENYEERMSTKQDVLLFLYDRGDAISKELMNLFEYLKVKLKKNSNLLLLRCDVKLNEVEQKLGFVIQRTPRLVFYRNRQKDYPIHFSGKTISARTVIDFILENTTFDFQDEWAQL